MELRHLRYFGGVAEDLNFSRAAQRLHVAQSALPWVQPKEILDPLRSLKLPADAEAKILRGNARQLFDL